MESTMLDRWLDNPVRPDGNAHAFITGPDGMGMRDLGKLGGPYSHANSVNDSGRAVGGSETADGFFPAFITGPDGAGMRSLGTLGGNYSEAYGVNEAGQAVGLSITAGSSYHAFITGPDGAGMRDLGTLGGDWSSASDINDAGQVAGWSTLANGFRRAFITGPDGAGMTDLNSLVDLPNAVAFTEASAINNAGQVIATASLIPEPESYALLLAGLVVTGFMARRRMAQHPGTSLNLPALPPPSKLCA